MKKHTTKYIFIIIIIVIGALLAWRIGFNNSNSLFPENSLSEKLTLELGQAKTYQESENNFTFSYPEKLNVTETPLAGIAGGKRILAESTEPKKGFEIIILPFDEEGPLTKERILQDLPDMVINHITPQPPLTLRVGEGEVIPALVFNGEDENIGPTFEIWFVYNGNLYQAKTYPEFSAQMEEILKTFK